MKQILQNYCIKTKTHHPITDYFAGEMICGYCGMVLKERMVENTDSSRNNSPNQILIPSKTGSNSKISMFDMGNSSNIPKQNVDSRGKPLSPKNKVQFSRLRCWDSRSKFQSRNKSLNHAFSCLDLIITKLNLPETIREYSAYLYRKAHANGIIRGASIESMVAACVYASCKLLKIPRSLYDVSSTTAIKRKVISHRYRQLIKELGLKVVPDEIDYLPQIANRLAVSEKIKRLSRKILKDAKKSGSLDGKNPIGLAAGSLYLAAIGSGCKVSLKDIANSSKVSIVTIRKTSHLLRPSGAKYIDSIEDDKMFDINNKH